MFRALRRLISRKSGSGSRPSIPAPPDYLRRKPYFRDFRPEDEKYFWAAYRKGALDIEEGLSKTEFGRILENARQGVEWFVLFAGTSRGEIPVGTIRAAIQNDIMEPHVIWFPWASPRNRIESIANFLNENGKIWLVLFTAREGERSMFDRLAHAGFLRTCGCVLGYYGDDNAVIYQTVRDGIHQ